MACSMFSTAKNKAMTISLKGPMGGLGSNTLECLESKSPRFQTIKNNTFFSQFPAYCRCNRFKLPSDIVSLVSAPY